MQQPVGQKWNGGPDTTAPVGDGPVIDQKSYYCLGKMFFFGNEYSIVVTSTSLT